LCCNKSFLPLEAGQSGCPGATWGDGKTDVLPFIDALPSSAHPMPLLLPRHYQMLVVVVVVVIVIGFSKRVYYDNPLRSPGPKIRNRWRRKKSPSVADRKILIFRSSTILTHFREARARRYQMSSIHDQTACQNAGRII